MGERLQILHETYVVMSGTGAFLAAMRADYPDACQRTCELLHDGSGFSAELCDWNVLLEIPVVRLQHT